MFWSIEERGFSLTTISHVKHYCRKLHSRHMRHHLSPERASGKSQLATGLWHESGSFILFSFWIFNRVIKITLDIFIQVNVQSFKSFWRSGTIDNSSKFLVPAMQENVFFHLDFFTFFHFRFTHFYWMLPCYWTRGGNVMLLLYFLFFCHPPVLTSL